MKEKLIEGYDKMNENDQLGTLYCFLFEGVDLSMEFSDLKECFASFGLEGMGQMTKSGAIRDQLKSL